MTVLAEEARKLAERWAMAGHIHHGLSQGPALLCNGEAEFHLLGGKYTPSAV